MTPKQKRRLFFLGLYALSIGVAVIGLSFNIKTVALNKEIIKMKKSIRELSKKKTQLEWAILTETRLENIDKKAIEELNMSPPKRIHYVQVNAHDPQP